MHYGRAHPSSGMTPTFLEFDSADDTKIPLGTI